MTPRDPVPFCSEDSWGSTLNSGTLCEVKSGSAFVFHVGKSGFGFCSQVINSTLYLILLTLSQFLPWCLYHSSSRMASFPGASVLRIGFPLPTDFSILLVFCFRHHYSSPRPAAYLGSHQLPGAIISGTLPNGMVVF